MGNFNFRKLHQEPKPQTCPRSVSTDSAASVVWCCVLPSPRAPRSSPSTTPSSPLTTWCTCSNTIQHTEDSRAKSSTTVSSCTSTEPRSTFSASVTPPTSTGPQLALSTLLSQPVCSLPRRKPLHTQRMEPRRSSSLHPLPMLPCTLWESTTRNTIHLSRLCPTPVAPPTALLPWPR